MRLSKSKPCETRRGSSLRNSVLIPRLCASRTLCQQLVAQALVIAAIPLTVFAQAWLPPKGEGAVSLGVQTVFFDGHFDNVGHKVGAGKSRASNLLLGVSYSFTDRLMGEVTVPYVITRYTGNPADLTFGNPAFVSDDVLDNGTSHSTFQDFRLELHYNVLRDSRRRGLQNLSVTPFFSFIVPSHSYEYRGESAFGRDLREYALGVSAGRPLAPVLPKAYVEAQYAYSFVQSANNIPLNHSNVDLEMGYFLPHSISVRGFGSWLGTHGGLILDQLFQNPALFPVHDRLLRASYWHLGVGTSYSLTRSFDLSFSYITYLAGTSTHYGKGISVGTSWSFSTRKLPSSANSDRDRSAHLAGINTNN
jgi:hypothetical protein